MSDKPMGNGIQHTPAQVRRNLYILILLTVILVSFYPALFGSTYKGSADFHAAIEMTGALLGLIAGFSMVMRFYTLGNRLHLFIGLAFFVNGAEDLVHGLLSFESVLGITDMPGSTLMQFIPGTYVTGRIMMALLLLLAPYANRWTKRSLNPKAETLRFSFAAIIITIFATVAAFKIPLPQFIYPGHVISRPVDFISAVILLLALVSIFHEYHRTRDILLWWISLSIAINAVGQFMMSFSKILYDLFFDMAHFYKIVGYAIPLLGFSLYQISVIAQRNRTEKARLKLEEQLRQSQKMEALGSLAGGIAHDFNNILGAIIGYTELTIDDIPKGSAAEHNLHQVMSAGNRAKETVQQILAFSREEETERKPVLLSEMVNEALHLLRSILPATINIRANIEEKGTPVSANPTMIHQVIMNICSNAAHAMKEKGGTLEITLTEIDIGPYVISAKKIEPGRYQRLTFTDTGHGMEKGILTRIFDPYFTTKKQGEGTGMGLSVVHGIIKSHKGDIAVYSSPGKGTTFHIFLPVATVSQQGLELVSTDTEPIKGGNERILFIDDEEVLAQMGKKLLEKLGYQVVSHSSSLRALETFRLEPRKFDIVITDQTMPEMTGLQLAAALRQIRADIPVILCSGFSVRINEENIRSKGINAFVMKPILKRDIACVVRNVLDNTSK